MFAEIVFSLRTHIRQNLIKIVHVSRAFATRICLFIRFVLDLNFWRIHLIVNENNNEVSNGLRVCVWVPASSAMTLTSWRWRNQPMTDVFRYQLLSTNAAQWIWAREKKKQRERENKTTNNFIRKILSVDDLLLAAIKRKTLLIMRARPPARKNTERIPKTPTNSLIHREKFELNASDIKLHYNDVMIVIVVLLASAPFRHRRQFSRLRNDWIYILWTFAKWLTRLRFRRQKSNARKECANNGNREGKKCVCETREERGEREWNSNWFWIERNFHSCCVDLCSQFSLKFATPFSATQQPYQPRH